MNARDTEVTADGPGGWTGGDGATDGRLAGRATRAAAASLGGGLLFAGLLRRSLPGLVLAAGGAALLGRALADEPRVSGPDRSGASSRESAEDTEVRVVRRSVTVGRPAAELADLWRDPETLDRIVGDAADVTHVGDDRLRWTARGPLDRTVTWETRVVEATSGDRLRWVRTDDSRVGVEAAVEFRRAADDRGTEVELTVDVDPPGGRVVAGALERADLVPEALAGTVLHRFAALAETGEIPTLEGNPSGRGAGDRL